MNIKDNTALHNCTSCQMCIAVCSQNAINIRLNDDGFYRPYIDYDKCTNCGLCTKICYRYDENVKITTEYQEEKLNIISAQNKSDELLQKVTSGGVADALAKELIKQGFVCIGVTYNDNKHRAEHVIVSTTEKTDAFRGSKYIQSYSVDAFKYLVKNVRNTKFAIFGLPCHIYAVDRFLRLRNLRDRCVLVDLFCHGCPSMLVWNKYERDIKAMVNNKSFDNVQFRSKAHGWGAFHVAVNVEGKPAFVSTPMKDEFYTLFFSDLILNDECSDCQLRSTLEYTDIRLGDYWGKRFGGDKKGVSAVALVTERGRTIFNAVKNEFYTTPGSMKEIKIKQSYGKVYNPHLETRKLMLDALRDKNCTLKDVVRIYESKQGIGYKVKKMLKYIDWYMPFDLIRFLKRFV